MISVGAGDALSVVEGFANIYQKNKKSRKPALPNILLSTVFFSFEPIGDRLSFTFNLDRASFLKDISIF